MAATIPPQISVITVTYNSAQYIIDQLKSVQETVGGLVIEQIVIDNASTDETVSQIKAEYPEVQLIVNEDNKGFAAANNQGYKRATGEYILFLNPDMVVQPGALQTLVDTMAKNPDLAIAAPLLIDTNGSVVTDALPRRFPTVLDQWLILTKLAKVFPGLLNRYLMKDIDPMKTQTVDSVRGAAMFVRRSFLEACGWAFDPRYYIWFEDVDLCMEANVRNQSVMHVADAKMIDHVGKSFSLQHLYWKQQQFSTSLITYFKKWGPWYASMLLIITRPLVLLLVKLVVIFRKKS